MTTIDSTIDIEYVKTVALEAGQRALTMIATMRSEFKADLSYVTDIDRATEQFVRQQLELKYPHFAFLGEEYGRHGDPNAPLWAVDPIDGTTNMVFGLPLWGVSIGLVVEGQAVAGVFYMPRTEELFWGQRGQGAYCNGTPLHATDSDGFHAEDTLGFTSTALKTLNVDVLTGRLRCLGSIAADIAYTARGTLCSLVGGFEGAYDMAATLCMAHEAGCVAEYLTGEPLDMGQIVADGRTVAPFVVAPPLRARYLQQTLALR